MFTRKLLERVCLLMLLLLLIVGSNPIGLVGAQEYPKTGGTFIYAISGDPTHLNPAILATFYTKVITAELYPLLMNFDINMNPIPNLATSWTVSSDSRVYTFNLLKNATWTDGTPITSADVRFTYMNMSAKYHSVGIRLFSSLDTIETPDPYTAVFKFRSPAPSLLQTMCDFFPVLPKRVFEVGDPRQNPANSNPTVTGGPFKFVEWVKADHITIVRNENYYYSSPYSSLPYLDKIVFRIIPDDSTRILALESGDVDAVFHYGFPFSQYSRLVNNPNIDAISPVYAQGTLHSLWFNMFRAPLNDSRVRQALAYSMDKTVLHQKAYYGLSSMADSVVSNVVKPWYNPNVKKYEYNLDKANQLLDAAGYPRKADGTRFTVELTYAVGYTEFESVARLLKEQWKQVGIELTTKNLEYSATLDAVFKYNFDIWIHQTSSGWDPIIYVGRFFVSSNIKQGLVWSNLGYRNNQVDQLFANAAAEADMNRRVSYIQDAQRIIMEEVPSIPLWNMPTPIPHKKEYIGLGTTLFSWGELSRVWWTKGTPTVTATATTATATTATATTATATTATATTQIPAPAIPWEWITVVVIAVIVIAGAYRLYSRRKK